MIVQLSSTTMGLFFGQTASSNTVFERITLLIYQFESSMAFILKHWKPKIMTRTKPSANVARRRGTIWLDPNKPTRPNRQPSLGLAIFSSGDILLMVGSS